MLNHRWLEERLLKDYKIKDKRYREWLIAEHQLIFYLDGLDEINEEEKDQSYNEIKEHSCNTSIVLTCRREDYQEIVKRSGDHPESDPPEIF